MIFDKLENAQFYYGLGERFQTAFEYLKNTDLKNLENGKYELDGENLFVSVQDYNTKPEAEGRFEAHKKYADIQFIVTGAEKIGYQKIEHCVAETEFDTEKDIEFLKNKETENNFVKMTQGDFLVLYPQDAHMPCVSINESTYVKKVVAKVCL